MKRDYLSRLSRAARWYLPPAEAAEVLEDYRELIEAEPKGEEELRRDIGSPKEAVGQLVQLKAYQRWMTVFAVLVACVLLPAVTPVLYRLFWWNTAYQVSQIGWTFLLAGMVLSFLWFQQNGKREGSLPKGVLPVMLIPLAGMAWSWLVALTALFWLGPMAQFFTEHPTSGPVIHWTLLLSGLVMGLTGLFGLVKARLYDRRWRAVYVWALAGILLCLSVWTFLTSMSLEFTTGWQTPLLTKYILITLAGLVGTGVSRC